MVGHRVLWPKTLDFIFEALRYIYVYLTSQAPVLICFNKPIEVLRRNVINNYNTTTRHYAITSTNGALDLIAMERITIHNTNNNSLPVTQGIDNAEDLASQSHETAELISQTKVSTGKSNMVIPGRPAKNTAEKKTGVK